MKALSSSNLLGLFPFFRLAIFSIGFVLSFQNASLRAFTELEKKSAESNNRRDIRIAYDAAKVYRIDYQVEHSGNVIVEYVGKDDETQTLPIEVKSRISFHERFLGTPLKPQAIRYYDLAQANIMLNQKDLSSQLDPENRLIVSRIKTDEGNKYQIASARGMLMQKELELIKNAADPLSYAELFTKSEVALDESWEPSRDSLARFLMVDYVSKSDVQLHLKEVRDGVAKIHIVGRVRAAVDDALTEIALAGIAQIDLNESRVISLRVNLDENRRAAQIAPGYQGRSKIDVQIKYADPIPQLDVDSLKELTKARAIRNLLKWRADNRQFELHYDPAWKLISAEVDAAIFRFVDNGDLLTQCNIVRLASRPADKPLSLKEFEAEVTKVIAKDPNSKVVESKQGLNAHGHQVLRILVSGIEEEVPVNWIYHNVSNQDGRQVTLVFTAEEQVLNRIALPTQQLVDGFRFLSTDEKLKLDQVAIPESRDAKAIEGNDNVR